MKQTVLFFLLLLIFSAGNCQTSKIFLFAGTYTDSKPDKGIYVFILNESTGELTPVSTGDQITNPSFITLSPNGRFLYACTDTKTAVAGSISAFAVDSVAGTIRFINKQSSAGANPVYAAVHKDNAFLTTGNYTEGNVAVLPINTDGSVGPVVQSIQFSDSSINKNRQEKPHIHSTIFSPGYDYVYLPDLGSDMIRVFAFNAGSAKPLTGIDGLTVHTIAGSGPRHMVFHPQKKWAYCIEEMSGMVAVYSYNKGRLREIQKLPSYQQNATEHSGADIHITPDGLFLYASNRVENTLSIFSIGGNGMLALLGHQATMGDVPRNFAIDPTGRFVLVANQGSNNIVIFKRDTKTGLLTETGHRVSVPSPSCLQMRAYKKDN